MTDVGHFVGRRHPPLSSVVGIEMLTERAGDIDITLVFWDKCEGLYKHYIGMDEI